MTRGRFHIGDGVRVREAYPSGHVRTPWYIRGQAGVICEVVGDYHSPEDLAYGRSSPDLVTLYRVRFRQTEIWPTYDGSSADTLDVEIYDHWLAAEPSRP